jgi:TetR/AcrR family transcriptional regulator, cholesterol catabolism regulator
MARTPKVVEDRRDQIIDAAMRIYSQKGFTRATNKDIAREAGITPGLIYYYFESKEALLKAIIETRSPAQLMTTLPPQAFELPPQLFLRMLILRALSIIESEQLIQFVRMLLPEMVHNSELASVVSSMVQRILEFLGSYFIKQVGKGALRPLDGVLTAQVAIGSVLAFVLRRQIICDPVALEYTHEQIAEAVSETVLQGILPR